MSNKKQKIVRTVRFFEEHPGIEEFALQYGMTFSAAVRLLATHGLLTFKHGMEAAKEDLSIGPKPTVSVKRDDQGEGMHAAALRALAEDIGDGLG